MLWGFCDFWRNIIFGLYVISVVIGCSLIGGYMLFVDNRIFNSYISYSK